jgi:polysaccharide biosynthesis protein PslH
MRVLYITNGFPYPLTSGYLRHYHLIRRLSRQHEIELFSIVGADFRLEHRAGLEPYTTAIRTFRSTGRSRSLWRKATRRILDLTVGRGAERAARALAEAVAEALDEHAPDVVLLSGKRTDPVIERLGGVPLAVDMCDATSARIRDSLRYTAPVRRLQLRAELARVRRVERRMMRAGDRLVFASQRDQDLLVEEEHADRSSVIPNGIDLHFWARRSPTLGADHVVFSGAMHYPPNADAALFLADRVMPLVWRQRPEARLTVVGRDPSPSLLRREEDPRITVTGFVEDVRPFLEAAAIFAAPLRFAAGIQNKLLEAMAMELPIVTSSVAADGLRTPGGRRLPITVANEPEAVADAILATLRRVETDPAPDAETRRYVSERFDWERAASDLDRLLESVRRTRE